MPSSRRLKVVVLVAILTVLSIIYVTKGAQSTYNSPFYTRTVEAIKSRQDTEARQNVIAAEKQRLDRVERLQKEHDGAISAAAAAETGSVMAGGDAAKAAGTEAGPEKQKPLAADIKEAVGEAAGAVKDKVQAQADKVKPVAGRKTMVDKVVQTKPATDGDDGVAKVGNVAPKVSNAIAGEKHGPVSQEDHKVEIELSDILKKGPIIIFSKSYCPFSKKAKHILLDLYSITPPPFVVELDQHELGAGLQAALQKSTGRRTVPNVLINGKSIGGGDDIEALHNTDMLAETMQSMGGKRVVSVAKKDAEAKTEVRFKA
ncbi:hypothetical protein LTR36_001036 [Oleoguttula mirabilis]|uniref:Glutaredoxin domain-containing protein n=1 Tax=Oleoguttula mirabilis TaxID=1507867 RepID=A0AAV9JP81_9PEZI|nr:hypothetical protein LTR36_001036 [Oleoguttula mirabilis]